MQKYSVQMHKYKSKNVYIPSCLTISKYTNQPQRNVFCKCININIHVRAYMRAGAFGQTVQSSEQMQKHLDLEKGGWSEL